MAVVKLTTEGFTQRRLKYVMTEIRQEAGVLAGMQGTASRNLERGHGGSDGWTRVIFIKPTKNV